MPPTRTLAASAIAALALALPAAALGTTITVTTTADAVGADGLCSLREAVTAANHGTATTGAGECPAGAPGADRIVLGPGVYRRAIGGSGEQGNAVGDLDVAGDLDIVGAGATATVIDAAGLDRVLDVLPGATVRIADLTLTGGATAAGMTGPSAGRVGRRGRRRRIGGRGPLGGGPHDRAEPGRRQRGRRGRPRRRRHGRPRHGEARPAGRATGAPGAPAAPAASRRPAR